MKRVLKTVLKCIEWTFIIVMSIPVCVFVFAILKVFVIDTLRRTTIKLWTVTYTHDYMEMYSEEIIEYFGEDCVISEPTTITREGEICACGHVDNTLVYKEWTIVFINRFDSETKITINNMNGFEEQIEPYINYR